MKQTVALFINWGPRAVMTTNFSFNNDSVSAFKGRQFSILLAELFEFSINNFKLSFLLAIQIFEEPMLEKRQILYSITRDESHTSFFVTQKSIKIFISIRNRKHFKFNNGRLSVVLYNDEVWEKQLFKEWLFIHNAL